MGTTTDTSWGDNPNVTLLAQRYEAGVALSTIKSDILSLEQIQKSPDFYSTLNQALRKINADRIYSALKNMAIDEQNRWAAAHFLNSLNHPEEAFIHLKTLGTDKETLIALFDEIEKDRNKYIKTNYERFIAYATLHSVILNASGTDEDVKRRLDKIEEELTTNAKTHLKKIRQLDKRKESLSKFILPISAFSGVFFALEMIHGGVNHLVYDTATYLGMGELSNAHFAAAFIPVILILSAIIGYCMYNLNYSSCKDGTEAYYLERLASQESEFNFYVANTKETLGKNYFYGTRAAITVVPVFSILGILALFELVLFEASGLHNIFAEINVPSPALDGTTAPLLPIIGLLFVVASMMYDYQKRDSTQDNSFLRKPLQSCSLLVLTFLAVLPFAGVDYNLLILTYSALAMICGLAFYPTYNNEAMDVLRCSDENQLEKQRNIKLRQEVFLPNEFDSGTAKVVRLSQSPVDSNNVNPETRLRATSCSF